MKPGFLLPLAAGLVLGAGVPPASADDGASVLVQIAPLNRGNLPNVLTVYGSIGTAASARQTLMAPLQAQVSDVYVRNGALVPRGAPLVRLVPTPSSQSAYSQAEAALKLASELAGRTQSLVASHLATDEQLFQAEKDESDARVTLDALKAQGADGPHTLCAPFKALVTTVGAMPGAIVSQGDGLVQLAQPGRLELNVGVIPNKAKQIDVGDPVELTPIGGGPAIVGTVVFRAAVVDQGDGLVPVDISVASAQQPMLGEMFRADITVGQSNGYVVPHDAILVNNSGETYVVQDHGMTAKLVTVQVVGSSQDEDVISGPLETGAPVILAGNYQLNDGDKIRLSDAKGDSSQ
jgi:membrane fusion protein, multidrug efflux system